MPTSPPNRKQFRKTGNPLLDALSILGFISGASPLGAMTADQKAIQEFLAAKAAGAAPKAAEEAPKVAEKAAKLADPFAQLAGGMKGFEYAAPELENPLETVDKTAERLREVQQQHFPDNPQALKEALINPKELASRDALDAIQDLLLHDNPSNLISRMSSGKAAAPELENPLETAAPAAAHAPSTGMSMEPSVAPARAARGGATKAKIEPPAPPLFQSKVNEAFPPVQPPDIPLSPAELDALVGKGHPHSAEIAGDKYSRYQADLDEYFRKLEDQNRNMLLLLAKRGIKRK